MGGFEMTIVYKYRYYNTFIGRDSSGRFCCYYKLSAFEFRLQHAFRHCVIFSG